jgi:hypothetical protein
MKTEQQAKLTSNANALQTLLTKGIGLLLLIVASIAGVTYMAPSTGHAGEQAAPTFVEEIPEGYRDWKLIAVSRLTAAKGSQLRTELGNDIAVKAYREGKLPFPDGDFYNGKPGNAALMKTCFSCHEPARDRDFVFTRYAP